VGAVLTSLWIGEAFSWMLDACCGLHACAHFALYACMHTARCWP
jgi:hypothetical protein